MAQLEFAELVLRFDANRQELRSGLLEAQRDLRQFSQSVDRELSLVSQRFAAVGQVARRSLGVFGALSEVGTLVSGLRAIVAEGANLQNTADRIGITAEALQRLQFAAEQSGGSARDIADALAILQQRIGLFASDGGGPAAAAISELGLQIRDTNGNVKDAETLFLETSAALQGVDGQAERAAIAVQLFGETAGPRLLVLLNSGVEGIRSVAAEAPILTDEMTRAAQDIDAKFNALIDTIGIRLKQAVLTAAAATNEFFSGQSFRFGEDLEALRREIAEEQAKLDAARADLDSARGRGQRRNANDRIREANERLDELQAQDPIRFRDDLRSRIAEVEQDLALPNRGGQMAPRPGQLESLRERLQAIETLIELNERGSSSSSGASGQINGSSGSPRSVRVAALDAEGEAAFQALQRVDQLREGLVRQGEAISQSVMSPMELYIDRLTQAKTLLDGNFISQEVFNREVVAAKDAWQSAGTAAGSYTSALSSVSGATDQLGQGLTNLFSIVTTGLGNVITEGLSFRDALGSIAEQLFDLSVSSSIDSLGGFFGDLVGGIDFGGLFGGLGGLFGGGGSGPGLPPGGTFTSGGGFMLAAGGPARAGQPYIVGERGPELFVPNMNGMVVPNHKLRGNGVGGMSGGGEGITNVFNIDARGSQAGVETKIRQELSRAVPSIVNASVQATVERRQRNPRLFG